MAGIDVNRLRSRHVIEAIIALATKVNGFSTSELAEQVRRITGWQETVYASRQAAYDLLKLRAKAVVVKVANKRRYIIEKTSYRP